MNWNAHHIPARHYRPRAQAAALHFTCPLCGAQPGKPCAAWLNDGDTNWNIRLCIARLAECEYQHRKAAESFRMALRQSTATVVRILFTKGLIPGQSAWNSHQPAHKLSKEE